MALRITRGSWIIGDSGAVAVNVKSGIVVDFDAQSSPINLHAYHISANRSATAVKLGTYPTRKDVAAAFDEIVNETG